MLCVTCNIPFNAHPVLCVVPLYLVLFYWWAHKMILSEDFWGKFWGKFLGEILG